jgi:hypothetical protein
MPKPKQLNLANSRCVAIITYYIVTNLIISNYTEQAILYIANLKSPIILGLPSFAATT